MGDQDYSEILPGLYVGSCLAVDRLVRSGTVKRVVNCTAELKNLSRIDEASYLAVPLKDDGTYDDQAVFADNVTNIMTFLDKESFDKSPVLLHCQMGVSRSPSVAAAYLLHTGKYEKVSEAKRFVKQMRPASFEGDAKNTYDTALIEVFEF